MVNGHKNGRNPVKYVDESEAEIIGTLDKGQSCDCSSCTFAEGKILTNGETYWDVKELEVFKINYI